MMEGGEPGNETGPMMSTEGLGMRLDLRLWLCILCSKTASAVAPPCVRRKFKTVVFFEQQETFARSTEEL